MVTLKAFPPKEIAETVLQYSTAAAATERRIWNILTLDQYTLVSIIDRGPVGRVLLYWTRIRSTAWLRNHHQARRRAGSGDEHAATCTILASRTFPMPFVEGTCQVALPLTDSVRGTSGERKICDCSSAMHASDARHAYAGNSASAKAKSW